MSYSQIIIHCVFATKNRKKTLQKEKREDLYRYIWKFLSERDCKLYRIGGVEDHIHILYSQPSSVAISDMIKEIKRTSSKWIKYARIFDSFEAWAEGYCALTCSYLDKQTVIEYIKNQEKHHSNVDSIDEIRSLLGRHGVEFDERYL